MKRLSLIVLLLFFAGCNKEDEQLPRKVEDTNRVIPSASLAVASNFILQCAKNANPMSDEEGEDLVEQCEKTALNLYAKVVKGYCYTTKTYCFTSEFIPLGDEQ